ncbi:MAG: lipoprotein [Pseudomonadales bacterium]|nr:lipoprotein [Pseudomonadales bacterium]MCB1674294.1 lipoprotein [Pseudomonadales bacterium]
MVFIMRVVCLLLSLLLLAACGQKGGLYLPEKKQPISPTSPNSQP